MAGTDKNDSKERGSEDRLQRAGARETEREREANNGVGSISFRCIQRKAAATMTLTHHDSDPAWTWTAGIVDGGTAELPKHRGASASQAMNDM
mmetsp:Transcript_98452/g.205318  ORF Transcript_98452/g.205318 Transcript_98452/m.205318 type:complete len:93 (+) Transcript_98452:26-304(+)